jgi:hypothetical protein
VTLYKNDVSQGTRYPDTGGSNTNLLHPPFTFTGVTFASGELKAEGLIQPWQVKFNRRSKSYTTNWTELLELA